MDMFVLVFIGVVCSIPIAGLLYLLLEALEKK
jgi:hypothetical protein